MQKMGVGELSKSAKWVDTTKSQPAGPQPRGVTRRGRKRQKNRKPNAQYKPEDKRKTIHIRVENLSFGRDGKGGGDQSFIRKFKGEKNITTNNIYRKKKEKSKRWNGDESLRDQERGNSLKGKKDAGKRDW